MQARLGSVPPCATVCQTMASSGGSHRQEEESIFDLRMFLLYIESLPWTVLFGHSLRVSHLTITASEFCYKNFVREIETEVYLSGKSACTTCTKL